MYYFKLALPVVDVLPPTDLELVLAEEHLVDGRAGGHKDLRFF